MFEFLIVDLCTYHELNVYQSTTNSINKNRILFNYEIDASNGVNWKLPEINFRQKSVWI